MSNSDNIVDELCEAIQLESSDGISRKDVRSQEKTRQGNGLGIEWPVGLFVRHLDFDGSDSPWQRSVSSVKRMISESECNRFCNAFFELWT